MLEGEAMGIVVSSLSGGGCGSGGYRGSVFCIKPLYWCMLCRGYRVVGCGGGESFYVVRLDVKKMMGGG